MATPAIVPDAATTTGFAVGRRGDAVQRLTHAVIHNRKATAGLVLLLIIAFVAAFPGLLTHDDPYAPVYDQQVGSSAAHLLGTTQVGQDVFAQLIWGTRLTLIITVVVGLLSTVVSVLIGVTAGYLGGMVDRSLSLLTDVFLIIPTLPLLIILAAYLAGAGTVAIVGALVVTSWAFGARQIRAQGLSLRSRDFLEAARVRGERRSYIIVVEILPTMISLVVASFLGISVYVVATAAGLQYLGLGTTDQITWGTMLHDAQQNEALAAGNPLWALAPGIAVALLGTAFALLNYAFDEIGNPALRPVRRRRAKPAA
jgi:peptide/nickel transport system permease protein